MSEEEEARRRGAAEHAERSGEYVEIGEGRRPRIIRLEGERPETIPEPIDFTAMAKCPESCEELGEDLGTMNNLELDEWRKNVTQNRDQAAARKDLADWTAFQREVGCVTKWTEQCETELSGCDKNCAELRDDFQGGTDNVLPKQARDFISNQAIEKLDNITLPRNEVVDAQKQLKCLLKYEDCITGTKKG